MLFSIFQSDMTGLEIMLAIVAFGLAIMIALVFHEWAHAFAAYKSGDPTAKMMGRMTLNPAKHVEPLGLFSFIFIGIGWAKPVPVNPFNYRNFRRGNFWVSIAGVLTNFIFGFVFSLGFFMITNFTNYVENVWLWALAIFFMFSMVINISLMIFNLLPIPPLDGYNMLRSITKPNNSYMQWARDNAHWLLIVVLLVSMFSGGIFLLRDGIISLFNMLWGAIF
ncbi:MAG: site-2 protease family protein [Firmicutes bacterium]|nr:site-2 protease family protein [Bacillota bacterium]